MFLTRVLRAVLAIAMFGLAASAVGCADEELNVDSPAGSKGQEMVTTMQTGRPVSPSASSMAQSSPTPGVVPAPSAALLCVPDGTCLGTGGCAGFCDPAAAVITSCARCVDGAFTDCTERACQP